jgi:hypothetical protein
VNHGNLSGGSWLWKDCCEGAGESSQAETRSGALNKASFESKDHQLDSFSNELEGGSRRGQVEECEGKNDEGVAVQERASTKTKTVGAMHAHTAVVQAVSMVRLNSEDKGDGGDMVYRQEQRLSNNGGDLMENINNRATMMMLDDGGGIGDGRATWSVRKWKRHAREGGGEMDGSVAAKSDNRKRRNKAEGVGVEGAESRKKRRQAVMQEGDDNIDLAVAVVQPRHVQ